MSVNTELQLLGNYLVEIPQQVVSFSLGGFQKNFAPSEDEYPVVGVQPFEGDLTKNKYS